MDGDVGVAQQSTPSRISTEVPAAGPPRLGYRPKTNSYNGWSVPLWEQYLRDLVVFGANAIELDSRRARTKQPSSLLFPCRPCA